MFDMEAKSRGFIVQQSPRPKTCQASARLMAIEGLFHVLGEGSNEKKY